MIFNIINLLFNTYRKYAFPQRMFKENSQGKSALKKKECTANMGLRKLWSPSPTPTTPRILVSVQTVHIYLKHLFGDRVSGATMKYAKCRLIHLQVIVKKLFSD